MENNPSDMREDVSQAYDAHDPEKLPMVVCEHCGKKTSASNTAPGSVGGGAAAAAGGGG